MSIEMFQLALIYSFVSVKEYTKAKAWAYILFPSGLRYLSYKVLNFLLSGSAVRVQVPNSVLPIL